MRISKLLLDVAREVGETIDLGDRTRDRVGPAFTRAEGPASRLLEQLAPGAWYVDEGGTTRLGRRPRTTMAVSATHGPVDLALGRVTLAAEQIATILPGAVVDGLEAVDVEHEVSPDGLRSTIWGNEGSRPSRRLSAFAELVAQLDPFRRFRGVFEYRVVTRTGRRLDVQPVRVSTRMPDLRRVFVRPGVAGCEAEVKLGSRVLVAFVDADPARPVVVGFEDADGEGFDPDSLTLYAGGMVGGERVLTLEAAVVLLHNVIIGLGASALPSAWVAPGAAIGVINAALAAAAAPAPVGLTAQNAAAPAIATAMALGGPGSTSQPYATAIAGIDNKTANVSGQFPSLGAKKVKAG